MAEGRAPVLRGGLVQAGDFRRAGSRARSSLSALPRPPPCPVQKTLRPTLPPRGLERRMARLCASCGSRSTPRRPPAGLCALQATTCTGESRGRKAGVQTPSPGAVVAPQRPEFILSKFSRGLGERKVNGHDVSKAFLCSVRSTLSKWKVRMRSALCTLKSRKRIFGSGVLLLSSPRTGNLRKGVQS